MVKIVAKLFNAVNIGTDVFDIIGHGCPLYLT